MEALKKLNTEEATEIFISTAKALINENIEETARELTGVVLDGKTYNLRISVSAFEMDSN